MADSFSSPTVGVRLVLRLVCFLIGIVAIICLSLMRDFIALGVTAAAVLWSLIHLILLERKRPVHPGFSVAFDLIAMGITLAFGILDMVAFSWVYNGRRKYFARRALGIASATLVIVTGLFHLVFLVVACRDVHLRRRRSRHEIYKMDA